MDILIICTLTTARQVVRLQWQVEVLEFVTPYVSSMLILYCSAAYTPVVYYVVVTRQESDPLSE